MRSKASLPQGQAREREPCVKIKVLEVMRKLDKPTLLGRLLVLQEGRRMQSSESLEGWRGTEGEPGRPEEHGYPYQWRDVCVKRVWEAMPTGV